MADLDHTAKEIAGEVWTSRTLYETLASLCARGGRFCGTENERSAREFLKARLAEYGLRVIAFSVEEWGLKGSACYTDELTAEARRRIAVDLNLDCVAGSASFTWVLNGFPDLAPFLQGVARAIGFPVGIRYQIAANSDHYNFVRHGVPGIRLMSGYEEPECAITYILSPGDTLDKVCESDLKMAAFITGQTALAACQHPGPVARHRSADEMPALLGRFV